MPALFAFVAVLVGLVAIGRAPLALGQEATPPSGAVPPSGAIDRDAAVVLSGEIVLLDLAG